MKLARRTLRSHEDDLTRVLKDTVPGLVQGSAENASQVTLSSVGSEGRLSGMGQRHRLLVRPDPFHVSIFFQPTLAFLNRVSEVLPPGIESARSSSAVLDDFVLKVYLPQLEEKVSLLFHQAVTGACWISYLRSSCIEVAFRPRGIPTRSSFGTII
jgi:exocyst complex component 4